MVKRLILLPFLLLLGFSHISMATEFTASVDRTQIGEQDTLTLKLRINEQTIFGTPELKPLEQDFRIQGQQRSQQFRSVNGKTESFTEWNIGLLPRRTGTLTIPSLSFKGESTQPISIEVLPPSAAALEQASNDFFFEVEVTPKTNPLVQSQLLYKEKLYYASNHNDANLSEFVVNNARVQPLEGVKNYTTVINGRRFGVYERNFAIFPETTGELVIPAQQFQASVPNAYDRWSRGQVINTLSKPISLNVKAIPANYPANAAWLPASQLILSETFSKDPSQWQAGEAVTRTISMQAQGIPGNQLPDVLLPSIEHLRYYPDQAVHDERVGDSGIIGHTEQSVAIVASSGGEFTLPEVRIPWWNTQTNTLEYAVLPAHKIKVAGAVTPTTSPTSENISELADNKLVVSANDSNSNQQWLWWLVLFVLAASITLNVFLLITRRKRSASTETEASSNNYENIAANTQFSIKQHWQAFSEACSNNSAADIRQHLLAWVNAGGLTGVSLKVSSLTALSKEVTEPALANALLELDSQLYGNNSNSAFNGHNLKALVQKEKKKPRAIKENNNLYPNL